MLQTDAMGKNPSVMITLNEGVSLEEDGVIFKAEKKKKEVIKEDPPSIDNKAAVSFVHKSQTLNLTQTTGDDKGELSPK